MTSTIVSNPEQSDMITGPQWFGQCKKINVLDSYICYFDSENNSDEVLIFVHGNPTSSYLWRNIIPHLKSQARCIALDLIGMGESGKSGNTSYRFVDHYKYFSAWLELLDLPEKVVIVSHDWGSALAFHWCYLNNDRIKALVHMESVVDVITTWKDWPDIDEKLKIMKTDGAGEEMVMKNNFFLETMLPQCVMRKLQKEELDAYLDPYKEGGECRRPILTWPREIPLVDGGPEDVLKIVTDFNKYLKSSVGLPKLFFEADPGYFTNAIKKGALEFPNTSVVKIKGMHFPQEDSADEIGIAIKSFIGNLNNA